MSSDEERFVDFEDRTFLSTIHNFYSDFMGDYMDKIKQAKWHNFKWKGLTLMKDPMSVGIYQQMLQDQKPKTILEFGTFEGGSALWMKDMMTSLGEPCVIHTFDINQEQIKLAPTQGIEIHHLDNNKIVAFVEQHRELFETMEHPILLIEDSHVNANELLHTLDQFVHTGDYVLVEDTLSEWKHDMTGEFVKDHDYKVDTYYCDFWGYNNSWNVNSILCKQ